MKFGIMLTQLNTIESLSRFFFFNDLMERKKMVKTRELAKITPYRITSRSLGLN